MSELVKHDSLTNPAKLNETLEILTSLDIIMVPEEDAWLRMYRKISDTDKSVNVFEVNNGSGDNVFIVFSKYGCIIKGFDHESEMSPHARDEFAVWPGIYDETPEALLSLLDDPMFEKEDVTFCVWCQADLEQWMKGTIENPNNKSDGFDFLMKYFLSSAEKYIEWANDYYEVKLDLDSLEQIFAGENITKEIVSALNPQRDLAEVQRELQEIQL